MLPAAEFAESVNQKEVPDTDALLMAVGHYI